MRRFYVKVFIAALNLCLAHSAYANNVSISNVSLASQNSTEGTIVVAFDITWQNSWRNPINYDAVWVFVKYSMDSGSTWEHATMAASGIDPSGFSAGAGTPLELIVPTDKMGCFIQRSEFGAGAVTASDIQLVWDWEADEGQESSALTARVTVEAVEMVYIPRTNSVFIGDGDGDGHESGLAFHLKDVDDEYYEWMGDTIGVTCDDDTAFGNYNDNDTTEAAFNSSGLVEK